MDKRVVIANMEEANWRLIPPHMRDAVQAFVFDGREPGDFLRALLRNDLKEAAGRADDVNIMALGQYVKFLYNYAPALCWGSEQNFRSWVAAGGLNGLPDDRESAVMTDDAE